MATDYAYGRRPEYRLPGYPGPPPRAMWIDAVYTTMKALGSSLREAPTAQQRESARRWFATLTAVVPDPIWRRRYAALFHVYDPLSAEALASGPALYDWVIGIERQIPSVRLLAPTVHGGPPGSLKHYPLPPPRRDWGPALWILMKCAAAALGVAPTAKQRAAVSTFFDELRVLMPCGHCRVHYAQMLDEKEPPVFECGRAAYDWVLRLEERVRLVALTRNERTHKQ